MSEKTIQDLGNELLLEIFTKLPQPLLPGLRFVCKRWGVVILSTATCLKLEDEDDLYKVKEEEYWYDRWPAVKKLVLYGGDPLDDFLDSAYNAAWKIEEVQIKDILINFSAAYSLGRPGSPWENLQRLWLGGQIPGGENLEPEHLNYLAEANWSQLGEIDFSRSDNIASDGGLALAKFLSRCPRLKRLLCRGCRLGDAALEQILTVQLPLLEEFNGLDCNLNVDAARTFVRNASAWPSLKILNLDWNFDNAALVEFSQADFPLLEELNANAKYNGYYDLESIHALRTAIERRWPHLKRLDLKFVDAEEHAAFLQGDCPKLEQMFLGVAIRRAEVMESLVAAGRNGRLDRLKTLYLGTDWDRDDEAEVLEAMEDLLVRVPLPALEELEIYTDHQVDATYIGDILAKTAQNSRLPALKHLNLDFLGVEAEDEEEEEEVEEEVPLDFGASFQHRWPNLQTLIIGLTDENTSRFIENATINLPNLQSLAISDDNLSADSFKALLNAQWPALTEIKWVKYEVEDELVQEHILPYVGQAWSYLESDGSVRAGNPCRLRVFRRRQILNDTE